jgi:hypothetical protein
MRTAKRALVSAVINGSQRLRKIYKHFYREAQAQIRGKPYGFILRDAAAENLRHKKERSQEARFRRGSWLLIRARLYVIAGFI